MAGADPGGVGGWGVGGVGGWGLGVGGRDPPCSRPPIFFINKLFNYSKKKEQKELLGIFYGRYVP